MASMSPAVHLIAKPSDEAYDSNNYPLGEISDLGANFSTEIR
jgi:hypothetical protein